MPSPSQSSPEIDLSRQFTALSRALEHEVMDSEPREFAEPRSRRLVPTMVLAAAAVIVVVALTATFVARSTRQTAEKATLASQPNTSQRPSVPTPESVVRKIVPELEAQYGATFSATAVADAQAREADWRVDVEHYLSTLPVPTDLSSSPSQTFPENMDGLTITGTARNKTSLGLTVITFEPISHAVGWSDDRPAVFTGAQLVRQGSTGSYSVWKREMHNPLTGRTVECIEAHGEHGVIGIMTELDPTDPGITPDALVSLAKGALG